MDGRRTEPVITSRDLPESQAGRFFVIGDDDTILGFRFAGLRGQAVSDATEASLALEQAIRARVPIIIITDVAAQMIRDKVNAIRFEAKTSVLVEVPTRKGPIEGRPNLMELIHEAVGIHV